MPKYLERTFEECAKDEPGALYADWEEGEFRCKIMRGGSSVCAYIGVREGHPFYGKDYSQMYDEDIYIDCHGGLTFASEGGKGENDRWPAGYWWFGWDYGHAGDYPFYDLEDPWHKFSNPDNIKWTPRKVFLEMSAVIASFRENAKQLRSN